MSTKNPMREPKPSKRKIKAFNDSVSCYDRIAGKPIPATESSAVSPVRQDRGPAAFPSTAASPAIPSDAAVQALAGEVAATCGFPFVPPVLLRRGAGGEWLRRERVIRIGRRELGGGERLWLLLAHELAHAQGTQHEGHRRTFWRRLAGGLARAGRLELLRQEIGYREGALRVCRDLGLAGLPPVRPFRLAVGQRVIGPDGRTWCVVRRFRRGGVPFYRLHSPRWTWTLPEHALSG